MPAPAEPSAARAAIEREVHELERLCGLLEENLVAGQWTRVSEALRDSRRTTHAFLNAMEAGAAARDADFDASVHARMRRVFDVREDQLARLQTFHDGVGQRLQTLSQWNAFARSIGAKRVRPRSLGIDSKS